MAARRKSRELALQMLFQWDLGGHSPETITATFLSAQPGRPEVKDFARRLFEGTVGEVAALDPRLRSSSAHWRLERMSAVDRNVLRLALYELLHCPETPPAAVMNEALELARRFSSEESVEFVNGVLDAVWKAGRL